MTGPETQEMARMRRDLLGRLKKRKDTGSYWIDMRADHLNGGRPMVRDPSHPGWPEEGKSTKRKAQAQEWVEEYPKRLGLAWCRGEKAPLDTVVNRPGIVGGSNL